MSAEKGDIYTILIASTLNRQLKQYNLDHGEIVDSKVKIQYNDFIDAMNLLIQNWKSKFSTNNIFKDIVIDKSILISGIKSSKFVDLFTISPDYLIVEIDDNYEQKISNILSQSIWHCATTMLQHVNELGEKFPDSDPAHQTAINLKDKINGDSENPEPDTREKHTPEQEQPEETPVPVENVPEKVNEPVQKDHDVDMEIAENVDTVTDDNLNQNGSKSTQGSKTNNDSIVTGEGVLTQDNSLSADSKDVSNEFITGADEDDEPLQTEQVLDPIEDQVEKKLQNEKQIEQNSPEVQLAEKEKRTKEENQLEHENVAIAEEVENIVDEELNQEQEIEKQEERVDDSTSQEIETEILQNELAKESPKEKVEELEEAPEDIDTEIKIKTNDITETTKTESSNDTKLENDLLLEGTEEPSDGKDDTSKQVQSLHKRKLSTLSTQKHKRFQHIAVNLINSIQAHRFSSPFLQAVNKRDASDYYEVVHEPKDLKNLLKAVKLKLDPPQYELIKQLERDIILMFANCVMYNKSDDDLVRLTISMKDDVNNLLKMFEEAELEIK